MRLFTTGGCGFIGSNFILKWINERQNPLVNIDSLNYAGISFRTKTSLRSGHFLMYLLDTCVISDFVKGNENTLRKVKALAPSLLFISTITQMEIEVIGCT